MQDEERIRREVLREHRGMIAIERCDRIWRERPADTGTRTDPSAPRLVGVLRVDIEGERFEVEESGIPEVGEFGGVDASAATECPVGVVGFDEAFGAPGDIAIEGNPVEVSDDQASAGDQQSHALPCDSRFVEPVPALAGGGEIERVIGKRDRFRPGFKPGDREAFVAGEFLRSLQHRGIVVEAGDSAALRGESPGEGTGAGREVKEALGGPSDAPTAEAIEEFAGESLAVGGVVLGGVSEADSRWIHGGLI